MLVSERRYAGANYPTVGMIAAVAMTVSGMPPRSLLG